MGNLLDRLKSIKEKEQKKLAKKLKAEAKKLEKQKLKVKEQEELKEQISKKEQLQKTEIEETEFEYKEPKYKELTEPLKNIFKHLYLHDYEEYKGVIIAWDDTYSKIPFKIIDDIPNPEDLKLIHYQDECLWLLWKKGTQIPKAYLEGEDFENDRRQETYITVFESKHEQ